MNINKKRNILLTGGRAPVTLDLSRRFSKEGHNIFIAESFECNLAKSSNVIKETFKVSQPKFQQEQYIEDLKRIIVEQKIDLLIPTCEEIFYISRYKNKLTPYCQVFVEDIKVLKKLHSKWDFIADVESKGLNFPKTFKAESLAELKEVLDNVKYPIILKPVFSRFSSKIIILREKPTETLNINISSEMPWVLQEFIEGVQYCSYSIVHNGIIKAHTSYKTEYSAGMGATIAFQHTENEKIYNWIKEFVAKESFNGQIAFDFIVKENGDVFPIECNPRATSGIHLLVDKEIEKAFFNENEETIRPNAETKKMISLAMILYGLQSVKKIGDIKKWSAFFFSSNDILFTTKDIKPFLYQFYSMYKFWKIARKKGITTLEASTYDIEWDGD